MINNVLVIDGHVHTFSSDQVGQKVISAFNKAYDIHFSEMGTGSVDEVLLQMDQSGIDYTVMVNFASEKIIEKTNAFTLEAANRNEKLIPFISLHPFFEKANVEMLEAYIQKGAKGLKFHTMAQNFMPTDPRLNDLYRLCDELKFPIVFHCGRVSNARLNDYADYNNIEPIIKKFSNIPVILTHMVDGHKEDVLNCAQNYENVYFDTSIVITGNEVMKKVNEPSWVEDDEVVEILRKIGTHRILFGSDYPWGSPNCDIRRIFSLNLSQKEKADILGRNIAKLLKIG